MENDYSLYVSLDEDLQMNNEYFNDKGSKQDDNNKSITIDKSLNIDDLLNIDDDYFK